MEEDLGPPTTTHTPPITHILLCIPCAAPQTYPSRPEPHTSQATSAPASCGLCFLGLTLPGPWSTHQPQPCLWGTVYFSMKAVSRSREPLCRRWIWLANCRLISSDSELRLGRWEFWKLCQRSFLGRREARGASLGQPEKGLCSSGPFSSPREVEPLSALLLGPRVEQTKSQLPGLPSAPGALGRWHRPKTHLMPAGSTSIYPSRTAGEGLLRNPEWQSWA